jgi:hypothetical protein
LNVSSDILVSKFAFTNATCTATAGLLPTRRGLGGIVAGDLVTVGLRKLNLVDA